MSYKKPNLSIKYDWNKAERDGVDLDVLAESISGFNSVIQEIAKIGKFKGGVTVKAKEARTGSIIFDVLTTAASSVPFENIIDYNNFLSVVGRQAIDGGVDILKAHKSLNDIFAKHPLDVTLLGLFIRRLIKWARIQKKSPTVQDEDGKYLPKNYAVQLHRMIKKRGYKKALRPFKEDQVTSITISSDKIENEATIIDSNNFENYLSEEEKILPEYEDGKSYRFIGRIVGLESSKGEYMKFKAAEIKREFNLLIAYPELGKTTDDYVNYYKKPVIIQAKIIRKSQYQKPKLGIQSIDLMQRELI